MAAWSRKMLKIFQKKHSKRYNFLNSVPKVYMEVRIVIGAM